MMVKVNALAVAAMLAALLAEPAHADIYMHNPRGSNNRNCRRDNNKARRNGNRLFDSENNDNGGYSCPRAWPFDCYKYIDQPTELAACQARNANSDDATLKSLVNSNGELTSEGAINTPRMHFYSGSLLALEWTVQHGLGPNEETHSNIVIQYACEDTLRDNCGVTRAEPGNACKSPFYPDPSISSVCTIRDGTPVSVTANENQNLNIEATDRIDTNNEDQDDYRYGRHETLNYYRECARRERNKGLWTADQNVANNKGARSTRQNPTGNDRYGLECPEESHYYPYWHWTPWKDVAIILENDDKCDWYKTESQNVKPRGRCACPAGECTDASSQPNNEGKCNVEGYTWCQDPAHNIDPPDCVVAEFNRQNHLGNVGGGTSSNQYNWTLPEVDRPMVCTVRIRYNISSYDGTGGADNEDEDDDSRFEVTLDGTAKDNDGASPIYDNDENEGKTYVRVENLGGEGSRLGFAINTDQHGRTFQDRSYTFEIHPAPNDGPCAGRTIHNLNVRGKRGNIVQAYPAVEYDFVPAYLTVGRRDCVHVQWTGTDYNPNRDGNNGEGGPYAPNNDDKETKSDRTNLVQVVRAGDNFPRMDSSRFDMFDTDATTWKRLAFLDQPIDDSDECWSFDRLKENYNNRDEREESYHNCMKLSGQKTPYFNAGPLRVGGLGEYHYVSTRNNNFSNRSQKAKLTVVRGGLSPGAIVAIVMVAMAAVAAALFVRRRRRRQQQAGGVAAYGGKSAFVSSSAPAGGARRTSGGKGGITAMFAGVGGMATRWMGGAAAAPGDDGYVIANYAHNATEAGELTFGKGDRIKVISRDPSGWWEGEINGQRGVFPANYVRK